MVRSNQSITATDLVTAKPEQLGGGKSCRFTFLGLSIDYWKTGYAALVTDLVIQQEEATMNRLIAAAVVTFGMLPGEMSAQSEGSAAGDLAKQLSNPISSLISVPYQYNYDSGLGATGTGTKTTVNIQPVIPFSISENWNLISRTILPVISQKNVVPGTAQSGIGDVVQSFFFSPKAPTAGGLIWGVGPVFMLPTGSTGLSADQFAAGVTGVVLKQNGPWTFGALANQLWSVGDTSGGTKISTSFVQPFVSYNTKNLWTFTLNTEATYNWLNDDAAVPINLTATKLIKIAGQPVSVGGGVRYWADSTTGGPDGWGARLLVTFLFPK
jgi:hypothetical protein